MGGCAGKPKAPRSAAYQKPEDEKAVNASAAAAVPAGDNSQSNNIIDKQKENNRIMNGQESSSSPQKAGTTANGIVLGDGQFPPALSSRFEYKIPEELADRLEFIRSSLVTEVICTYRTETTTLQRITQECDLYSEPLTALRLIRSTQREIQDLYNSPAAIEATVAFRIQAIPLATNSAPNTVSFVSPKAVLALIEDYLIQMDGVQRIINGDNMNDEEQQQQQQQQKQEQQQHELDREKLRPLVDISLLVLHITKTVINFNATQIVWWEHNNPMNPLDSISPWLNLAIQELVMHSNVVRNQSVEVIDPSSAVFNVNNNHSNLSHNNNNSKVQNNHSYVSNAQNIQNNQSNIMQNNQSNNKSRHHISEQKHIESSWNADPSACKSIRTGRSDYGENFLDDDGDLEHDHNATNCLNYSIDVSIRRPPGGQQRALLQV